MSEIPDIGEKALNKAAEIGLSSQLDEVENLEVSIKTEPLKLIQGEIEKVQISGEGLVMQKDLRMTELEMQITSVAINPLSVAFGKIELTKPTIGKAQVILTEADINRAFNSEYVRDKLQNHQITVNGQETAITPQHIDFHLPGEGKVVLNASILLRGTGEIKQVGFSAVPCISANGKNISLQNVEYGESQEISPELTQALIAETGEILNLSNFDLEGMSLRVYKLELEKGKLTLQAEADVDQIPTA
ncbi:DUF2993 domain-containing protein [Anabaena azotica]|uniref:LmeA family phospholipid-binding protein n=1 Tax=Anabaena azotica TaxID=197653 RepID=UPI0039A575FE